MARDDNGRLVWASTPTAIANIFFYDHTGQRSEKLQTHFNGSGGGAVLAHRLYVDPSYEVDVQSGTHSVHVFAGSRRLATLERSGLGLAPGAMTEQVRNFHPDHVGSNTLVTDHRGEPIQKMTSEPFGGQRTIAATASPGSSYLFTDQEYDAETGLDEFGARYYDSQVGRFLSPDPALIGPDVGATFSALVSSSQAGNAFAYVENRPTRFVDPTGEFAFVYVAYASYSSWSVVGGMGVLTTTCVAFSSWMTGNSDTGSGGAAVAPSMGSAGEAAGAALATTGLGFLAAQILNDYRQGLSQPAQMSQPTEKAGEQGGEGALDSDVKQALDEIDRGADRPNVRNPKPFENDGRGGSAALPKTDANGNPISYTEHTVKPRPPGGSLDGNRIVTGSDGSVHVTTDHFGSFTRVR